jgi:hypothetical protein
VVTDKRCDWCGGVATKEVEVLPAKKTINGFKAAVKAWACTTCARRFAK